MKKKQIVWAVILIIIAALAVCAYRYMFAPTDQDSANGRVQEYIIVSAPASHASIASPLAVSGEARSQWYSEASFPIIVVDWDGRIIGEGSAQARGDQTATSLVPFAASVSFETPECAADYCRRGAVIFRSGGPLGDPSSIKAVEIPVYFK